MAASVGDSHEGTSYTMTSSSVAAKSENLAPEVEAQDCRHHREGTGARTCHAEAGGLWMSVIWATIDSSSVG